MIVPFPVHQSNNDVYKNGTIDFAPQLFITWYIVPLIYDGQNMDASFKAKLDKLAESPKAYLHADSIAKLADKINVDAANLQQSYEQYQEACQSGKDKFGKDQAHLEKFSGHDFYAVYAMPGSWGTIGGVQIDHDTFAVKTEDHVENLYAVGEMSTSDLFTEYYMGGFSFATYTTEGRLLAEELAKKLY